MLHAAAIQLTGTISVGSILTLLTAVVGLLTVYAQNKATKQRVDHVVTKVEGIDKAVNGVGPDRQVLVKNVQDIHDQLTTAAAQATFDNGHATAAEAKRFAGTINSPQPETEGT
jgi:hypothetical protein